MSAPEEAAPVYIEPTAATFERDVLERSLELPVLVDFWATWCAPCRTLGPILEKLAVELSGRFVLAKVDIDRSPELAQAFRVQSVPSVVLLVQGRPVDGFLGAQPEAAVRAFLEPHLPPPAGGVLEVARALEEGGDLEGAVALLGAEPAGSPSASAARLELARLLIELDRVDEARATFDGLPEEARAGEAGIALAARLDLMENTGDLEALAAAVAAAPEDAAARLAHGRALLAARKNEEGLEELLAAARLDLHHEDDAPRKAMIEAFEALGWDDPLTIEFQRRLAMLLMP